MENNPLDSLPQNEWDRLIISILKPFFSFCKNDTLITKEDLQQEAWIGLLAACERYDARKAKFVTYAYWYIRGHVMRYVAQKTKNKPSIINESQLEDAKEYRSSVCNHSEDHTQMIDTKDLSDTIFAKVADQEYSDYLTDHFIYDKSFRTIAKERGVSHETIATRIHKLLDLLEIRLNHENA